MSRTPIDFDIHMCLLTEAKFVRLYRVSKADFKDLVAKLSPRLRRTHTGRVATRPASSRLS
jgi:hypothetical protein